MGSDGATEDLIFSFIFFLPGLKTYAAVFLNQSVTLSDMFRHQEFLVKEDSAFIYSEKTPGEYMYRVPVKRRSGAPGSKGNRERVQHAPLSHRKVQFLSSAAPLAHILKLWPQVCIMALIQNPSLIVNSQCYNKKAIRIKI